MTRFSFNFLIVDIISQRLIRSSLTQKINTDGSFNIFLLNYLKLARHNLYLKPNLIGYNLRNFKVKS